MAAQVPDDIYDSNIMEELAARLANNKRPSNLRQQSRELRCILQLNRWYPAIARKFFQPLLVDPRNDIFVLLTFVMLFTVFLSGVLLLVSFSWWRAILHIYLVLYYAQSYTAMLHNASHKPLYKKDYSWMEYIIPYVLGPMFGQTWNTYYNHHVKHHHVEDNGPNDLSSTLRYQRDSMFDFCCYFLRFFFFVSFELTYYFLKRRWYWNAATTVLGEFGCLLVEGFIMMNYSFYGGIFVFVVPLIVIRFGMMSGNWGQHAFVAHEDPKSQYKSSTICIRHSYNCCAFNDGYHTAHHLNPLRHWTELPGHLVSQLQAYAENNPVILRDLDFMGVWKLLMKQDYDTLAEHFVHIGPPDKRPPKEEIIRFLKSRVRRFTEEEIAIHYGTAKEH